MKNTDDVEDGLARLSIDLEEFAAVAVVAVVRLEVEARESNGTTVE